MIGTAYLQNILIYVYIFLVFLYYQKSIIIGIPYAMNQTGLLSGTILIILVAILTDKSLRILIETGKHADVQSYEMLMEAVFGGQLGFIFISVNMFIMNFGAMVCYLLIIKQTFASVVLGNEWIGNMWMEVVGSDLQGKKDVVGQCFLIVSSLLVILPLSMQRVSGAVLGGK